MTCVLSQDAGPGLASWVCRDKLAGLQPSNCTPYNSRVVETWLDSGSLVLAIHEGSTNVEIQMCVLKWAGLRPSYFKVETKFNLFYCDNSIAGKRPQPAATYLWQESGLG